MLPPFSIFALIDCKSPNLAEYLTKLASFLPCLSLNVLFLSALSLSFSILLFCYFIILHPVNPEKVERFGRFGLKLHRATYLYLLLTELHVCNLQSNVCVNVLSG